MVYGNLYCYDTEAGSHNGLGRARYGPIDDRARYWAKFFFGRGGG